MPSRSQRFDEPVARFRLRFLLQEIDLQPGETVLGRSPACHVTIEDPLVSRRHAAVRIRGDQAVIEDLGARNGVEVNGQKLQGARGLVDGDRIRIGTQELVFCSVVEQSRSGTRPTGFLCRCAVCGVPYPAEAGQCPQCGSKDRVDEETLSGVVSAPGRSWTSELLTEVLVRAVELRRWDDVERILYRSRAHLEEALAAHREVVRSHLDTVADAAAALAAARGEGRWAKWVLDIHAAAELVPRSEVSERISTLPAGARDSLRPSADRLVQGVRARGGPSPEDRESFARLETLAPGRP